MELRHIRHISTAHLADVVQAVGLRLVKLTFTVRISCQEAFVHLFYSKVESEGLPIDGEMHVAGERCVRAGGPEDRIGEIILHVGGIGVQVVQVQLLHTVVGLIIHVLTEVQFEGISVGILIGSNEGETGISFVQRAYIQQVLWQTVI